MDVTVLYKASADLVNGSSPPSPTTTTGQQQLLSSPSPHSLTPLGNNNNNITIIANATATFFTTTTIISSSGGGDESSASVGEVNEMQDFIIGLSLAVGSSIFIGSSFILKKLGLIRYARKVSVRAGQGGLGYLREWMWWAGMILMTVGEFANFAAYAFAPATLVTPLGALSVIVSAVLSARVLKEKLNILGKLGCVLCVLGSTLMVIHSPKEQEVHDVEELMLKMKEPGFILYALCLLIVSLVMIFYFSPRYGQKNVLVYITICASLGAFTVMGCKGVGTAITATARGHNEFKNWLTYALITVVIVCIVLQLNYLNKALDTFNTAVVTPIYYVFFTSCVIVGSAILFKEFFKMDILNIAGDLCGFFVIVIGIFLLNAFKDLKISLRSLPNASKESDAMEAVDMLEGDLNSNNMNNGNYTANCRTIEAEIQRNMSGANVDALVVSLSGDESDFNDMDSNSPKANHEPYYNGSTPA